MCRPASSALLTTGAAAFEQLFPIPLRAAMVQMISKSTWVQLAASLGRRVGRATEAHILYPAIALLGLTAIWATTLNLIGSERVATERRAAVSSHELAETYQAQVVRALREIDQSLKLVKYADEPRNRQAVLQRLGARALLPPDLLFVVSIADGAGNVVASTRPFARTSVTEEDYFLSQRRTDPIRRTRPSLKRAAEERRSIRKT